VIRVLVAASSPTERAELQALLASSPRLRVVGASDSGQGLPAAVDQLRPDVVVLALEPGDEAPLDTVGRGASAFVLLADDSRNASASEALRAGARAILPRLSTLAEIEVTVEAVAAGLLVLHPDAAETLLPTKRGVSSGRSESLTAREIEVLRKLAAGLGNKELAERLGISEHTVKFHIASIFAKLGAGTRTEAVTLGLRRGLIVL
jgi:two-component system, NarL family, response regulator YdfI